MAKRLSEPTVSDLLLNKKNAPSCRAKKDHFLLNQILNSAAKKESLPLTTHQSTRSSVFSPRSLGDLSHFFSSHKKNPSTSSNPAFSPRSLGNLIDVLDPHRSSVPSPKQSTFHPRSLGDLSHFTSSNQEPLSDSCQKQSPSDFHQQLFQSHPNSALTDSSFPSSSSSNASSSSQQLPLFKNLSFIVLGVFGLGAIIFLGQQLIDQAQFNFAAQDSLDTTNSNSPLSPRHILTFQGRLSDLDQASVTQTLSMNFSFYNTSGGNTPPPIGGNELWQSSTCSITPNEQGVFSVNLGAGNGDGSDNQDCGRDLGNIFAENSSVWLQITVEDEVLFPRQLIKSVPYALNSATLQGFSASQSATANTVPVVDNFGNLNFNTNSTNFTNFGSLGLISQAGDILLAPGSGHVYIGNQNHAASLSVNGDATISGSLVLKNDDYQAQLTLEDNNQLVFKTKAGQGLWQNQLVFSQQNSSGTAQTLSLNQGSFNFNLTDGPSVTNMTVSEYGTDNPGLSRISAPKKPLVINVLSQEEGNLNAATYKYAYSFITANGKEGPLSTSSSFTSQLSQKQFLITDIDIYPQSNIVARRIYRTKANQDTFYLIHTLNDNISTSFVDNIDDDDLYLAASNQNNSTGTYQYKVSFIRQTSETNPSLGSSNIVLSGDNRRLLLEHIPLSSAKDVMARKIYRTLAGGQDFYLLATLSDNSTTSYTDTTPDSALVQNDPMPLSGGILVNNNLALQFNQDGSIISNNDFVSNGRLETSHGDYQGLQLPTSLGTPSPALGQKIGDLVYDSLNQLLYVFNGSKFITLNQNASSSNTEDNYCHNSVCRFTLDPEYPSAVITGEGENNLGTISSGYDIVNNQYRFNYYQWYSSQTTKLDNLSTNINLTLPYNFSSWQEQAITLDFLTSSASITDNALDFYISKNGSDNIISKIDQIGNQVNQWSSAALGTQPLIISASDLSSLNVQAGDTLNLRLVAKSKNSSQVKFGQINLNYYSQSASSSSSSLIWQKISGLISPTSNNDIVLGGDSTASAKIGFFNLNGTGIPTLYLKGNLFLDSLFKRNFFDLARGNDLSIRTLDENNVATERFTLSSEGKVGIGESTPEATLDVGGDISLDGGLHFQAISQTEAGICDEQNSGKIFYNSADWQFYVCQATNQNADVFAWIKLQQ